MENCCTSKIYANCRHYNGLLWNAEGGVPYKSISTIQIILKSVPT